MIPNDFEVTYSKVKVDFEVKGQGNSGLQHCGGRGLSSLQLQMIMVCPTYNLFR